MEMNWDYIAGFFDGEGTLVRHIGRNDCISSKYFRFSIAITNTNLEVLTEMQKYTNLGHIYKLKRKLKPHHKDAWMWAIVANKDVLQFIREVKSKCIVKKDKTIFAEIELSNKMNKKKNPENYKERIINMAKTGSSLVQMAKNVNLDRDTISRYLRIYDEYDNWLLTQPKSTTKICKSKIKYTSSRSKRLLKQKIKYMRSENATVG